MVSCPCYVFLEASAGIPGVQRVGFYVLGYHGVHADDCPIADGCTLQNFDIPTQPDVISYVDGSGRIQQPLFCIKNWVSVTCPDVYCICNHAFLPYVDMIRFAHADDVKTSGAVGGGIPADSDSAIIAHAYNCRVQEETAA